MDSVSSNCSFLPKFGTNDEKYGVDWTYFLPKPAPFALCYIKRCALKKHQGQLRKKVR